jgi:hypothetical protein
MPVDGSGGGVQLFARGSYLKLFVQVLEIRRAIDSVVVELRGGGEGKDEVNDAGRTDERSCVRGKIQHGWLGRDLFTSIDLKYVKSRMMC